MRKILRTASLVALAMIGSAFVAEKSASATAYSTSLQYVSQVNAAKSPTTSGGLSGWFALTGVASLGTCATWNGVLPFKFADADKNILSTVTAAFLAGKKIQVTVDDSVKETGTNFCYAQFASMQ
jgi:hypothetical protein